MVDRACAMAEEHLAPVPVRLAHVRGVARAAERQSSTLAPADARTVVVAAWLHDVGYAPTVQRTGFHPVDGAQFVREAGFPNVVVSLVAHHTGAGVEAAERGLSESLACIPLPPGELLDTLTYADMTTGPDGEPIDAQERIAEILTRYGPDDPVHRAVQRSAPDLLAAVRRVESRFRAARAGQPR